MSNRKPYLLFDFDGTIADSFGLGVQIFNNLAPKYGIRPFSEHKLHELRSIPTHKALKQLNIPLYKLPVLIPIFLHEFKAVLPQLQPFEGIRQCLQSLQDAKIPFALLTSNSLDNVKHFLDQHDLNHFDWLEAGSGLFKKQITIARQIKKHGLNKDDVIYIGDETRDIVASHKCGIRIISVTWGFHTREVLKSYNPDFVAEAPSDILRIVSNLQ